MKTQSLIKLHRNKEKNTGNFTIYEIVHREAIFTKKRIINVNISDTTNKEVKNVLNDLKSVESKNGTYGISFSDVIYELSPKIDEKTGAVRYDYEPFLINNKLGGNVNDYIKRFNEFDIDKLPLIEVAYFLKVKVEKSNQIKALGRYIPNEKKIILGTDGARTFIHELAHAVDFALDDLFYEENYTELVAELSTIVLCKLYNIPNNVSYSKNYLDCFSSPEIDVKQLIHRVSEIVEGVKMCKEIIENECSGTL